MKNIIEKYFEENPKLKLSIKSIRKRLNLKKRQAIFFLKNSEHIRQVLTLEVGSRKYHLMVFTYR